MAHHQIQSTPTSTIAASNDALRYRISIPGHDREMMTASVVAFISDRSLFLGFHRHKALLRAVHDYDALGADGDPYGEQDFGNFVLFDERFCPCPPTLHEPMASRSGAAAVGLMSGPRGCCAGDEPPALSTDPAPCPPSRLPDPVFAAPGMARGRR